MPLKKNPFTDSLSLKNIYFNKTELSGACLDRLIDSCAGKFISYTGSNSPFVYIYGYNHPKTLIGYLAAIRAGKIAVLIDPVTKDLELSELFSSAPPFGVVKPQLLNTDFDFSTDVFFKTGSVTSEIADQLQDVCTMVFTAAEDGYLKGAMLSKDNLIQNAIGIMEGSQVSSADRICSLLPFHHLYGLQTGLLVPAISGGSAIVIDIADLRVIKSMLLELERACATQLYTVPVMYYLMLTDIASSKNALKNNPVCVSGGCKLSDKIFSGFRDKIGIDLREGYGLTEASPVCTFNQVGSAARQGSIGRAQSCCEVEIVDKNGKTCTSLETGEIRVKGPIVMKGYYKNSEITKRTVRDGWLYTGDLGYRDEDGFFYYTGLKKRMLNVGGKNVYPAEVERLMKLQGNVKGVTVFAGPSRVMGDTVEATVELHCKGSQEEDEFRKWCSENISSFKIPKIIRYI
ncbi:Long-chain-fatty-acid--CoA ligase [Chitinispirillum alkaliphilum]|nr:Long-chain-fatty-acid--CoA ligase [Chitinispirillum alkaliphilum]